MVPLSDTLNMPAEDRLLVALAEEQPLPAGVYYLRLRTPEGPGADLLLVISRVRLALQTSAAGMLIWATDVISATPAAGLPIVLYQDGALIQRGTTDLDGVWRIARANGAAGPRYIALATGDQRAIASSAWGDAISGTSGDSYRAWLATDRAAYRSGERVALAGLVRRAAGQSNELPPAGLEVQLTARQLGAPDLLYRQSIAIDATGLISASFVLPADARPGEYIVGTAISGAVFHTTFVVRAEIAPPLDLTIEAPGPLVAGAETTLPIELRTLGAVPIAGATVSWTLGIERMPFPTRADYSFGDDELAFERPAARSGSGVTDGAGLFSLVISNTVGSAVPLRYRLAIRATEPGGPSAEAERACWSCHRRSTLACAAQPRAARRAAGRDRGAGDQPRRPAGCRAQRLSFAVYRRTWVQPEAVGAGGSSNT